MALVSRRDEKKNGSGRDDAVTRSRRAPPPADVPALRRFQRGDAIEIVDGSARGLRGFVVREAAHTFGPSEPLYVVNVGGLPPERLIRETFLRRRSVP